MDKVEEDGAKAVIEKLKSENRKKKELYESLKKSKNKLKSENKKKEELCGSLRKSQNEQIVKIQEAILRIEKHVQELIEKGGEIPANEKRRFGSDKAKEKNMYKQQKIQAFQEEIKSLKELLAASAEKCLEADKNMMADHELSDGDRALLLLEEKNRQIEEQLRLKKEEFKRLGQKNAKLGEQVNTSEKQKWRKKSALVDVIATLQARIDRRDQNASTDCQDAHPSDAEGTKEMEFPHELDQETQELLKSASKASVTKLKLKLKAVEHKYRHCSKTLKAKEAEWSSQLKKLTSDLNKCKSQLERKDKAVVELMTELENSYSLMLELEHNLKESEELKEDLSICKSELEDKDAFIEEMMLELEGYHSVMTDLHLQNEDWRSQLQIMKRKFDESRSELDERDKAIEELMAELETCHSLMIQLKLQIEQSEMTQQLEKIRRAFNECRSESESKDRTIEELMRELEDSRSVVMRLKLQNEEAEWSSHWEKMARDFNDCMPKIEDEERTKEELLKELEDCHSQITGLILQSEGASLTLMILKAEISEAQLKLISKEKERDEKMERYRVMFIESSSALEETNSELEDKICDVNGLEFELQIWKSFADRLRVNLEENYEMRKKLEASLLEEVEFEETFNREKNGILLMLDEKYRKVSSLQQQTAVSDQELEERERNFGSCARAGTKLPSESLKKSGSNTTKENKILDNLRRQLGLFEQESLRRELEGAVLAKIAAERNFNHEKQNLIQLVDEKNQRIDDLMHLVTSLEEKFNSSLKYFSLQLYEKQAEINLVSKAWEKITSAEIMGVLEVEEKKLVISTLEDEIHNIQQKLEMPD